MDHDDKKVLLHDDSADHNSHGNAEDRNDKMRSNTELCTSSRSDSSLSVSLSGSSSADSSGGAGRKNEHDMSPCDNGHHHDEHHSLSSHDKQHLDSGLKFTVHPIVHPNADLEVASPELLPSTLHLDNKKTGNATMDEAERKRLKRRLLVSSSVTLLCYITGYLSLVPVQAQYLYQRFARDYFNLTNVTEGQQQVPCSGDSNDSLQEILNQIQSDTSRQTLYMDYAQYAPAIFSTLFLGSYTDYLGRRFMVILPCLGAFLKSVVFLLVIYLELDVNYLYIAYAVDGVCGSIYALTLGLTASVADITVTSAERALTFALLEGSLAVAGTVSQIGTGYLIKAVGYVAPAVFIVVLLLLAIVSVVVFMPETFRRPAHIILNPAVHLRKVFGFYILDGTVHQRFLYMCGLVIYFFVVLVTLGKMSVETLYEINSPFCWDSVEIGLFGGLKMLVQVIGCIVAVKVLQACMRIEFIALLGFASGIASYIVEAFAFTDWMMYLVPVVGILAMVVNPIIRTLMSRMAPANSQGALFASMSALETVCHLASTTMYNTVYMATLQVFAGAVFLLMAAFCFTSFVLIIVFMLVSRNTVYYERVVEVEAPAATNASEVTNERTPLLSHVTNGQPFNSNRTRNGLTDNNGDTSEQSSC